jgi:hypothetical protein
MVFGYNALGRFSSDAGADASSSYRSFTPPFGGEAGIERLFNYQLSGQVSWLIPASVIAIIALLVLREKVATTVFLAGWFLTFAVMFSAVSGLHQFYVTAMVIPMVALIAMALEASLRAGQKMWIATIVGVSALWSVFVGLTYAGYLDALPFVQLAVAALTLVGLFAGYRFLKTPAARGLLTAGIIGSLIITPAAWAADTINHPSSINPAAGPADLQMGAMGAMGGGKGGTKPDKMVDGKDGQMPTGMMPDSGQMPTGMTPPNGMKLPNGMKPPTGGFGGQGNPGKLGDPGQSGGPTMVGGQAAGRGGLGTAVSEELISYLKANRGTSKFLVAVFGAQTAAPIINATGESVLPIGGFDGSDPAPTLEQFKKMVDSGEVKYVLSGGNEVKGGGMNGSKSGTSVSEEIQSWVTAHFIADTAYKGAGTLLVYSK